MVGKALDINAKASDEEKYKEIELLLNKLSKLKTTEEKIKHLERDLKPDKGNNGGRW